MHFVLNLYPENVKSESSNIIITKASPPFFPYWEIVCLIFHTQLWMKYFQFLFVVVVSSSYQDIWCVMLNWHCWDRDKNWCSEFMMNISTLFLNLCWFNGMAFHCNQMMNRIPILLMTYHIGKQLTQSIRSWNWYYKVIL